MRRGDVELLAFVATQTDPSLSNEARYWKALQLFRDRAEQLGLALHRIAGHGNITSDKAREIAAEALGIRKPE